MKKILLLSIFLLLLVVFPQHAFANGAGLPAFFKVDGKFAVSNPLQILGITAQSFLIPQDYTTENYVINRPINFEIDESKLLPVIDQELLQKTKFSWDFGDGTKAEGLNNTHVYSKIGSYILILSIKIYEADGQPPTQFVDSFLINVLPENGKYKLPQAVLEVNSRSEKDPLNNPLEVNLGQPVDFDATKSTSQSKIVSYLWNFGDGETSTEISPTHIYTVKHFSTVVLRVKDNNGFISDAFVGLSDNPKIQKKIVVKPSGQNATTFAYLAIASVVVVLIIIVILVRKKK